MDAPRDHFAESDGDGVPELAHRLTPGTVQFIVVGEGLEAGALADGEVANRSVHVSAPCSRHLGRRDRRLSMPSQAFQRASGVPGVRPRSRLKDMVRNEREGRSVGLGSPTRASLTVANAGSRVAINRRGHQSLSWGPRVASPSAPCALPSTRQSPTASRNRAVLECVRVGKAHSTSQIAPEPDEEDPMSLLRYAVVGGVHDLRDHAVAEVVSLPASRSPCVVGAGAPSTARPAWH